MWPDRISSPGPLALESDALLTLAYPLLLRFSYMLVFIHKMAKNADRNAKFNKILSKLYHIENSKTRGLTV